MSLEKNLLLILLMTLIIPLLWSQSKSSPDPGSEKDSTVSSNEGEEKSGDLLWTDKEVQELTDELSVACQEEKDTAVDEAVKVAVIPLIAENDILYEENDTLRKNGIVSGIICFGIGYIVCTVINAFVITNGGG